MIDYDHEKNRHTYEGAFAALGAILGDDIPQSFLDVGCGTGTWIRAAIELGVADVKGIDGHEPPDELLEVEAGTIDAFDLSERFDLGRRYDMIVCLEVGEHLEKKYAENLIASLVSHSDKVLFSAAIPGQPGQHHVNCQWPSYWQDLFNAQGFVCDDSARWLIWEIQNVEPWYRQNMFWAKRNDAAAGSEPRLKNVIHPDFVSAFGSSFESHEREKIELGSQAWTWYLTLPFRAAVAKLSRRMSWLPIRN